MGAGQENFNVINGRNIKSSSQTVLERRMSSMLTKEEKLSVFQQDLSLRGSTYADHTAVESAGGRFAREGKQTVIQSGSQYPMLPKGNSFASDPVPPEEPSGFSVEAIEPVGTAEEIEASRRET